jgi:alpha-1,6-mannosyltransferase
VAMGATAAAERAPSAKALCLIVGIALFLRGVLLLMDPLLSSDIYRYVWDGKVQAFGVNPYRYVPADEALAALRDTTIYPNINRADYAVTIYPPVAEMFFYLATRLGENVTAMRAALLACEGVTATIIALLLQRLRRPLTRLVAYAWHPLPLWQIANSGHVDALMVALMMLGIWLAIAQKPLRGAAAVTLGALAKPFAALALPALWRPWDWKLPLACIAVIALCYLPYLSVGTGALGFLSGYLAEEGLKSGDRIWLLAALRTLIGPLPGDYIVYVAISALIIAALAIRAAFRARRSAESMLCDINRLLLVSLFLLSPNYPWYFLAAMPFVALVGGAPVWVLTVGASLLHAEVGGSMFVPLLIRQSILYGAFLLACACSAWRARQGRSAGDA